MGIITLFLTIPTYLYATRIQNKVRLTKIKILAAISLTSILVGVSLLNRENIVERFLHINDESNMARLQSLKAGLQIFLENPIWGKGPNYIERNFAEIVGYKRLYSETIHITVHNMQVGTLAKYGLSGFTAISLYLYFIFDSIVTKNRGNIASQSKAYIVALLIILLNALTLPVDINDWFLVMLSLYVTLGKPCKA
jgi:O-antigen ligase